MATYTKSTRSTLRRRVDAAQLLRDLGGVAAVRRKLEILGIDAPTDAQMRKWVLRGSLPAYWLLVLMEQAEAEGRQIRPTKYLVRD